ncbi:hypothetical protein D3C80_1613140 [compost metagenome]
MLHSSDIQWSISGEWRNSSRRVTAHPKGIASDSSHTATTSLDPFFTTLSLPVLPSMHIVINHFKSTVISRLTHNCQPIWNLTLYKEIFNLKHPFFYFEISIQRKKAHSTAYCHCRVCFTLSSASTALPASTCSYSIAETGHKAIHTWT